MQPEFASAPTHSDVVAVGQARVTVAELAGLRRQPPPIPTQLGAALALRQADEHSLVALQALLDAVHGDFAAYERWGVMVASSYPGRVALAQVRHRFRKLGPPGVNPMASATQSLHSAASTLSLTLGMRGPAFGVSGGRNYLCEGLLAACSFRDASLAPGMFIVLTTSDPPLVPDHEGRVASPDSVLYAVALGVAAENVAAPLFRLTVVPAAEPITAPPPTSMRALTSYLQNGEETFRIPAMGGAAIFLTRTAHSKPLAA